jgi:ATP-binding cassette subfamily B protein/ATP-binding cassette subfamily C protein
LRSGSFIPDVGQQRLSAGALGVTFEHVTFAYDHDTNDEISDKSGQTSDSDAAGREAAVRELVLDDVSFHLPPGQILGLLGRTGSGKTTVSRLLVRFIDPIRGVVRLGNDLAPPLDIREVSLFSLRERVSLVTQEVQLFQASLRDNITFFDNTVSDERLLAVIEQLGLTEWLGRLPHGLDTSVATDGLSAGEAQLVAVMRVFLQDPGLVILDEASSRLDPFTERMLQRAMSNLLKGRSGIIIAHRLQTIELAHKLLILSQGRVAEFGDRLDLAGDGTSHFAALLQQETKGS